MVVATSGRPVGQQASPFNSDQNNRSRSAMGSVFYHYYLFIRNKLFLVQMPHKKRTSVFFLNRDVIFQVDPHKQRLDAA